MNRESVQTLIQSIRRELSQAADVHTRQTASHFFKEEVRVYGVKTALVTSIAKQFFQPIKDLTKDNIFSLCEELWKSGLMEEAFIACQWSYQVHDRYEEQDLSVFERWLQRYVSNWATCDTLCNHSVGTLLEMFPVHLARIKTWTQSENRWMRRAAAVSLIIPARKGKFLADVFQISDCLLTDGDDLVQKGYGWLLKAASQAYQAEVLSYVMENKVRMPRTALRYAIEKMPADLKKQAMEK